MDTLAKASEDRSKQGSCEVEISYGGELDLHRSFIMCSKNAGHGKFIPIDKFNIDHLPALYQDEDVVDAVRAMADLTVRLSVKYVSESRPKTYPNSDKPYPCYSDRGQGMMRVGSGWVKDVEIISQGMRMIGSSRDGNEVKKIYSHNHMCQCKACDNSPTRKREFATFKIMTASHVVYDDLEGENTTCHLFFDRGDSPDVCSDAIAISGVSYVRSNVENDSSEMVYYTHDLGLASRLYKLWCHYIDTHMKVGKKWNDSTTPSDYLDNPEKKLTIIVSHPHGCSKQVSLGFYSERKIVDSIYCLFTYSTATCPGSSGAPVYVVERFFIGCTHPHCGNDEENKELNFCGAVEF